MDSIAATLNVPADYLTIQEAIDAAINGDSVLVAPGTYAETLVINKQIEVRSRDGAAQTFISESPDQLSNTIPPAFVTFGLQANNSRFVGFTLSGAGRDPQVSSFGTAIEVGVNTSSVVIAENIFENNHGAQPGIVSSATAAEVILERNIFRNNSCGDNAVGNNVGIAVFSGPVRAINNVFYNNRNAIDRDCRALIINTFAPASVYNNTFYNNQTAIIYYRSSAAQNDPTSHIFRNNIISNNDNGFEVGGNTSELLNPVIENNIVHGNTQNYIGLTDQTGTNSNLSADPNFANIQNNDFRLSTFSPAIDSGNSLIAPSDDFDNNSRPMDGNDDGMVAYDIGAFEFIGDGIIDLLPTSQTYFPLTHFNNNHYLDSGLNQYSTFVSDDTKTIGGVQATEFLRTGIGPLYFTNNQSGLFLHQELDQVNDSITYSPPAKVLNSVPAFGDFVSTNGIATIRTAELGTFTVPYSYQSRVVGIESITVPAGTFDALIVDVNSSVSGFSGGFQIELIEDITYWLVEGIGVVRQVITQSSFGTSETETYELQTAGVAPTIISPTNGATLPNASQAFNWVNNNTPVTEWWMHIGTTPGGQDIINTQSLGAATSYTSDILPTDGNMVYVRHFFRTNIAGWKSVDYSYQTTALPLPVLTAPADASILTSSNETFAWDANGNFVSDWWLYLGDSVGAKNILDSGIIDGDTLSKTVSNLPTDGSTIHARLFYRGASMVWKNADFTFTAFDAPSPEMTAPINGATLTSNSETFSWNANGNAVTDWWFRLGTTVGGQDIYESGNIGSVNSVTVNTLPTDGSVIHGRLFYRSGGGAWKREDFTFMSFDAPSPMMTSPTDGATLTGGSETFSWNANGNA
ncbi:MAG: choice-of-anchor Q domain-containing protein, partial [Gammaproteobacteria bacterium]